MLTDKQNKLIGYTKFGNIVCAFFKNRKNLVINFLFKLFREIFVFCLEKKFVYHFK